jgi:glycosyltransferase involved in cell wall biosynthesis
MIRVRIQVRASVPPEVAEAEALARALAARGADARVALAGTASEAGTVPPDVLVRVGDPCLEGDARGAGVRVARVALPGDRVPARWADGLSAVDEIWVPVDGQRVVLVRAGIDAGRVRVVPSPLSVAPSPADPPLLADARGTVVLAPLEWSAAGGWDLLLDAWCAAARPNEDATLAIVAWSPTGTSAEEMHAAAAAHLGRRGVDPERIPDVLLVRMPAHGSLAPLAGRALAAVDAGRSLAPGRHALEAMALGLPIAATPERAAGLLTAEAGWPLPAGRADVLPEQALETPAAHGARWARPDGGALADALRAILDDPKGARSRGERARVLAGGVTPERAAEAAWPAVAAAAGRGRPARAPLAAEAGAGRGGVPARYAVPLRDAADPGCPPRRAPGPPPAPAGDGRRLAIVDTHFPWRLSGFRFHEFSEIARRLPDTVVFSLYGMSEPWPGVVHPLADFPRLAPALGITDVYLVFLNLAVGVLGLAGHALAAGCGGVRPDISLAPEIDAMGLRVHATLYPGGGLTPDTAPELLRLVADRCATVFTNLPEVAAAVPAARFSHAVTATSVYRPAERPRAAGLRLAFAADDRPRKGLPTLIEAVNALGDDVHLDVVGPHERWRGALRSPRHTFHGWLTPEELAGVYARADVFVSPVTREEDRPGDGERRLADGFPTSCAVDAMATGCCVVTSNPRRDVHMVRPGVEYIEIPERDPGALADVIALLRDEPDLRERVARAGARRVRDEMSVEGGVAGKLAAMGLAEPGPVPAQVALAGAE